MSDLANVLSGISDIGSRRKLWTFILDYFTANGIDKVSYHSAATPAHAAGIATHGFPADWVCHYIGDNLEKVDPIPGLAALTSKPFRWSDAAKIGSLSQDNLAYLKELYASNVGDGLAFMVFGPKLQNAYVGLGFASIDVIPDPQQIADFQTVAQMAHLKYCEISGSSVPKKVALSSREHEALEWVARGKSNGVIAQIMDLSPHTVDTLIRRIFEKLEVRDRTTAAIKALGSGLLQYQDIDVA